MGSISVQCDSPHSQARRIVCEFVEQCGNVYSTRIEFKINCQFLKLMEKVLCAAPTYGHDATDNLLLLHLCRFNEEHW